MAQPLLPGSKTEGSNQEGPPEEGACQTDMADLRIFWGPEICRLEYLMHLLDTGRVKDDHLPRTA